jgi:hypothetical protein
LVTKSAIIAISSCSRLWQWKTYRPGMVREPDGDLGGLGRAHVDGVLPALVVRPGFGAVAGEHPELLRCRLIGWCTSETNRQISVSPRRGVASGCAGSYGRQITDRGREALADAEQNREPSSCWTT